MQAELEKWIAAKAYKCADIGSCGEATEGEMVVSVADLRALLSRFVLCEKEPVGYFDKYDFDDLKKAGVRDMQMVIAAAPLGYFCCPLYAPASPLGNADMGKEGGE